MKLQNYQPPFDFRVLDIECEVNFNIKIMFKKFEELEVLTKNKKMTFFEALWNDSISFSHLKSWLFCIISVTKITK